jgi:hypothetical protein
MFSPAKRKTHQKGKALRFLKNERYFAFTVSIILSGFGGLEVACWPLIPKFAGLKPKDFSGRNILSMPSFGGEVKPSVPCRRFAACKTSRQMAWNSPFVGKITDHFSPIVPPFSARGISRRCGRGGSWRCKWVLPNPG